MKQLHETVQLSQKPFNQIITRYDEEYGIGWIIMNPKPRPCFTTVVMDEARQCQIAWQRLNRIAIENGEEMPVRNVVVSSIVPGVYNLGGDMELFLRCIRTRDREGLREYARLCLHHVHILNSSLDQPVTTIALVQGDALGGGFELALSCNVIIAEKSAKFGFPEVLFNLFPGMGAYSFLSRKVGGALAEKIIMRGDLYSASEMYEMGIVNLLVEDERGEDALYEYVKRSSRKNNAFHSLLKVRRRVNPVPYEELLDVAEMWVDAAMKLGPRELKLMERLIRAQDKSLEEQRKMVQFRRVKV